MGANEGKEKKKKKMNSSSSAKAKAKAKDEGEAEGILICLDAGLWIENKKTPVFALERAAILYYCEQKFKYNSGTRIGLCTSSVCMREGYVNPTRDLNKIRSAIDDIWIRGNMRFADAIGFAASLLWTHCKHMPKRIVVFAGGFLYSPMHMAHEVGKQMKDFKVACDVITFGLPHMGKRLFFDTFISEADNDGNCNICHVPPECSPRQALYKSYQIFFTPRLVGVGAGPGRSGSGHPCSLPQHDKNKAIVVYLQVAPYTSRTTDCPFCQTLLLTLKEKNILYQQEFLDLRKIKPPQWFLKVNPLGTLPLIKFSDGSYVSDSDVILSMIEEMYPHPPLAVSPDLPPFGFQLLPKIHAYLKAEDKDTRLNGLLRELRRVDAHFAQRADELYVYGKADTAQDDFPFVDGAAITSVDLSLAPKLYHFVHACKLTIPQNLVNVQRYMKMLFDLPSFRETKPSIEDVVEGWCKRLRISEDKMPH